MSEEPQWKALAQKGRDIRDKSMAEVDKFFPANGSKHLDALPDPLPLNVTGISKEYLSAHDFEIVETDPVVLLKAIASRKYTAVEVASAYMHASVLAQRVLNCVTEFLPEMAYNTAVSLDKYMEENGKTIGPLHGLPVSMKDKLDFAGRPNNYGITALVDNITEKDSAIVEILRDSGAVYYQRTTQPQFLMHVECDNNIYGYTLNPFNTKLTCGGSSGGEGASGGFHSSCIGIGTDIGGSIRAPAAMQGTYGFKPTSGRLPSNDTFNPLEGSQSIEATIGPMGRTLEITTLVTKLIVDSKPWIKRRELAPIPWNLEPLEGRKKIRVGVMQSDGIVTPQPPVKRAIEEVTSKLKSTAAIDGIEIEVVPFEPFQHDVAMAIAANLFFEDGGETDMELVNKVGEPLMPLSQLLFSDMNPLKPKKLDIRELWDLNVKKGQYSDAYNLYWMKSGIDVLVCPVLPGPPQPHDTSVSVAYTAHWNFLDYPGISFPVTVVDQEKDIPYTDYTPTNMVDASFFERYQPEIYKDAPVSLQLVAQRNEDEKLLECMAIIEKALKN